MNEFKTPEWFRVLCQLFNSSDMKLMCEEGFAKTAKLNKKPLAPEYLQNSFGPAVKSLVVQN